MASKPRKALMTMEIQATADTYRRTHIGQEVDERARQRKRNHPQREGTRDKKRGRAASSMRRIVHAYLTPHLPHHQVFESCIT
eukprot:scaffold98886_cov21-Tisochrysis_lutea.AAC.1